MPVARKVPPKAIEGDHILRHRLLKAGSRTLEIYRTIKYNPGVTSSQLRAVYPSSDPITKLYNEGLIRPHAIQNSRDRAWHVVPENEIGTARVKVDVDVTVYMNERGEYSVSAKLIGQLPYATKGQRVKMITKRFRIAVPKPAEYAREHKKDTVDIEILAKEEDTTPTEESKDLIIETSYTTISTED